jgi:hypothetical protein
MAFKRNSASAAPDNIVWVTDYFKELSKGLKKSFNFSKHDVTSIVFPKSGKGYVLNIGGKFACFIWNNSPDGKAMKEFLTGELQFMPCILINTELKALFEFGFDDEREGTAVPVVENKWSVIADSNIQNDGKITPPLSLD